MEDLSRVTGLSKGSLYGAFGDKEALFQRVLKSTAQAASSAPRGSKARRTRRWTALRNWLTARAAPTGVAACLKATAELAWENDAIATVARGVRDATGRLPPTSAAARGMSDPAADAAVLGGLILTTHRGLEALAKAGVNTESGTGHRRTP